MYAAIEAVQHATIVPNICRYVRQPIRCIGVAAGVDDCPPGFDRDPNRLYDPLSSLSNMSMPLGLGAMRSSRLSIDVRRPGMIGRVGRGLFAVTGDGNGLLTRLGDVVWVGASVLDAFDMCRSIPGCASK